MTTIDEPLRALALSYAPAGRRAGLAALLSLDSALGQVLRTTREPLVGQMRLAWWREALERLDAAPPPGEPVLQALATDVLPYGVTGAALARMVDGWEPLLGEIEVFVLQRHAVLRGARLFELAATVCATEYDRRIERLGRGWALADLANNLSNAASRDKANAMAWIRLSYFRGRFRERRWPTRLRALSALALIARMNLAGRASPRRVLRLAWHRMTGY